MWRSIGKGESHLAELVEPLVKDAGFEVAYRAHQPYVELKVRYPASCEKQAEGLAQKIDATLAPWLYERDQENHAAALVEVLAKYKSIDIYDGVTQGHLSDLLSAHLREKTQIEQQIAFNMSWENHDSPADYVSQICDLSDGSALALVMAGFDTDGGWALGVRRHGVTRVKTYDSPYKVPMLKTRNLKAVAYLAVKEWLDILDQSTH
jgi:hypothetical protein